MKEKLKGPWDNPGYDGLRVDKKRIPPPTEEEARMCNIVVAQRMLKDFKWQKWMGAFIDREGRPK